MELWLKKIISALLLPLPISLSLLIIGLLFLWFTRRQRIGTIFITAGFIILLIFSLSSLPNFLLNQLESKYQPIQLVGNQMPRQIVVLGGGVVQNVYHKQEVELSSTSLSRLLTGILLAKQFTGSQLILSGGSVLGISADAVVMKKIAEQLGIQSSRLLLEAKSKDTQQQAIELKKIVGERPFILVTSASHMPRAVAIFRRYGLNPIPDPTEYLANYSVSPIKRIIPNAKNLIRTNIALHEYLGLTWAWFRGYL